MVGASRMQRSSGKQELAAETQIESAIPFALFRQHDRNCLQDSSSTSPR